MAALSTDGFQACCTIQWHASIRMNKRVGRSTSMGHSMRTSRFRLRQRFGAIGLLACLGRYPCRGKAATNFLLSHIKMKPDRMNSLLYVRELPR
jgi:hypothetical protein